MFATWRSERFSIGGREVSVRLFPTALAGKEFIDDWLDLEKRAVEGNMFLSPHFILPALQYLTRKPLLQLAIFRRDGERDCLIGVGTFVARPPAVGFPLPHLEAYESPHTFLTGMLLDRDNQWLALETLGTYLSRSTVQWCGLKFARRLADGALDQVHQDQTITSRLGWDEYGRQGRAILCPDNAAETLMSLTTNGSLGKDLRRKRARLEKLGRVESRVLVGKAVTAETIETFLRLEDMGWKHEGGTSVAVQSGHADFFRDMTRRFARDGRALFCELLLDGRVIASSSNYVSGKLGFAFKIGWDPDFASAGPGFLNELELMRWLGERRLEIDYMDSGAAEGAYIQRLWQSRREVVSGILVGGNIGNAILPALTVARDVKRAVMGRSTGS